MHVAIHAIRVYIKSWTIHCPNLSSASVVDFIDTANVINVIYLISAADLDTVPLCHFNIISSSRGQSIISPYCWFYWRCWFHRYCPVVSTQHCFCQHTYDEFNLITNLLQQKKSTSSSNQTWSTSALSLSTITIQGCPHITSRFCPYSYPEYCSLILRCQTDLFVVNSFSNQVVINVFFRVLFISQHSQINFESNPKHWDQSHQCRLTKEKVVPLYNYTTAMSFRIHMQLLQATHKLFSLL
jgi:hypothetical protein